MAKTTTKSRGKTKRGKVAATAPKRVSTKSAQTKKLQLETNLLHKLIVGGNVALAALAVSLMAPAVFPLTVSYLTRDVLLSEVSTVFVPAERVLLDVDARWLLIGLLLFGALYSLLLLTRWRAAYDKALKGGAWDWRWAYMGVSFALLTGLTAVLTGIDNLSTVKLMVALTGAGFAFAWLSERQRAGRGNRWIAAYWLGLASALIAWKLIACHALFTTLYGLERLPWHAYAAQAVVALGVVLVFVNLWLSNTRDKRLADSAAAERNYLVVTAATQVALAVVLLIGWPR